MGLPGADAASADLQGMDIAPEAPVFRSVPWSWRFIAEGAHSIEVVDEAAAEDAADWAKTGDAPKAATRASESRDVHFMVDSRNGE